MCALSVDLKCFEEWQLIVQAVFVFPVHFFRLERLKHCYLSFVFLAVYCFCSYESAFGAFDK